MYAVTGCIHRNGRPPSCDVKFILVRYAKLRSRATRRSNSELYAVTGCIRRNG